MQALKRISALSRRDTHSPRGAEEPVVRIGSGVGFFGGWIEPARELTERNALDYLVFECWAERAIAVTQTARMKNLRLDTTSNSRRGSARSCRQRGALAYGLAQILAQPIPR